MSVSGGPESALPRSTERLAVRIEFPADNSAEAGPARGGLDVISAVPLKPSLSPLFHSGDILVPFILPFPLVLSWWDM